MTEQMPAPSPMITVNEAAAQLRVRPETVRYWIKNGLLPAYRYPGTSQIRINAFELAAWFEASRHQTQRSRRYA